MLHLLHHVERGDLPGPGHGVPGEGRGGAEEGPGEEVGAGPDHAGELGLQVQQDQLTVPAQVHQQSNVGPHSHTSQHHLLGLCVKLGELLGDGGVAAGGEGGQTVARMEARETLQGSEA